MISQSDQPYSPHPSPSPLVVSSLNRICVPEDKKCSLLSGNQLDPLGLAQHFLPWWRGEGKGGIDLLTSPQGGLDILIPPVRVRMIRHRPSHQSPQGCLDILIPPVRVRIIRHRPSHQSLGMSRHSHSSCQGENDTVQIFSPESLGMSRPFHSSCQGEDDIVQIFSPVTSPLGSLDILILLLG